MVSLYGITNGETFSHANKMLTAVIVALVIFNNVNPMSKKTDITAHKKEFYLKEKKACIRCRKLKFILFYEKILKYR